MAAIWAAFRAVFREGFDGLPDKSRSGAGEKGRSAVLMVPLPDAYMARSSTLDSSLALPGPGAGYLPAVPAGVEYGWG